MVGNTHTCFYADLKPWMRLSLWNGNLLPGASVEMMWWETRIISQLFGKRWPFRGWQSSSKPLSEHTFGWIISGFNTRSPKMIVNHPKITKGSDWWMMFINVGKYRTPISSQIGLCLYWNILKPMPYTHMVDRKIHDTVGFCIGSIQKNFPNTWVKLKIIKNRIIHDYPLLTGQILMKSGMFHVLSRKWVRPSCTS